MAIFKVIQQRDQSSGSWSDWKWQQRNAIRSVDQLLGILPGIPESVSASIRSNQETRRFQITPYALSLIRHNEDGTKPLFDDPLWRQFVPYWPANEITAYAYDGETENWELPGEMVTPIAQHKYDNRIIVRLSNVCHGYCQFCYEALRTLEKDSAKLPFQQKYWDSAIDYLRQHYEVEEVILSGGEPLMLMDEQLDRVLSDLRGLGRPILIRIHTRALTFNPFRITDDLVSVLGHYNVNSVGVHVTHPNEITDEFIKAVARLHTATPIIFANIPLLAGINDNIDIMHSLGMMLYKVGVIPHYLYHFMPFSPGAEEFRTSVRAGIELIRALKRRVTNLAVPEFVLPHQSGKYTPPLLGEDEQPPTWLTDVDGNPVVSYTNWRGELIYYPDTSIKEKALAARSLAVEDSLTPSGACVSSETPEQTALACDIERARAARAILEVDCSAIRHNAGIIKRLSGGAKLMAVVKGNAYGLGAHVVARILQACGASAFAVDNVAEGIALRASGIAEPIFIIDGDMPHNADLAVTHNLIPGIAHEDLLMSYQRAGEKAQVKLPIWIVANVGFNRSGYRDEKNLARFTQVARGCDHLEVRAIYAHLTNSNDDSPVTLTQIRAFEKLVSVAEDICGSKLETSLFASHGLVRWARSFATDWVRPGLLFYGEHAFDEAVTDSETLDVVRQLRPAVSLRSRIAHLLDFTSEEGVGYSQHNKTRAGQRLATVAIGFRSGYPFGNRNLYALVHGRRAPIFGNVGMDTLQIDVTQIQQAQLCDWVTLIGKEGDEHISIRALADAAAMTPYELMSRIDCQRVYVDSEDGN